MTVTTTISSKNFETNGAAVVFPFNFKFFRDTDLVVFWINPEGDVTTLTLNSDYTVQGAGAPAGGSITTTGPVLGLGKLTVSRRLTPQQLTDLRNQGPYFAEIHEDAFDLMTMLIQQALDGNDRAMTFPVTDQDGLRRDVPSIAARAEKVLGFDPQGQPVTSNLTLQQLEQQPTNAAASAASAAGSAMAAEEFKNLAVEAAAVSTQSAAASEASKVQVQEIAASLTGAAVPLFAVMWWPSRVIPAGYAPADGQTLSRALFPDAWTGIADAAVPVVTDAAWLADATLRGNYSRGDGAATFRMPDYNGKQAGSLSPVLRGDGGLSSGVLGRIQQDAIREHGHEIRNVDGNGIARPSGGATGGASNTGAAAPPAGAGAEMKATTVTGAATAAETRMTNVTGCFIVKLFGAVTNQGAADAAQIATELAALTARVAILEAGVRKRRMESTPLARGIWSTSGQTITLSKALRVGDTVTVRLSYGNSSSGYTCTTPPVIYLGEAVNSAHGALLVGDRPLISINPNTGTYNIVSVSADGLTLTLRAATTYYITGVDLWEVQA